MRMPENIIIPAGITLAFILPLLRIHTLKVRDVEPVHSYHAFYGQDKRLKKCPRCGYDRIYLCRIGGKPRWSKWFRKCPYCRFKSEAAHTRYGANRKWNKSSTVTSITFEGREDGEAWIPERR